MDSRNPFCLALHADPGSLGPPPGCQASSQLWPQPGSPSEPGYPPLSPPPGVQTLSPFRTAAPPLGHPRHFRTAHFGHFPGLSTWAPGDLAVCQAVRSGRVVPVTKAVQPDPGAGSQPPAHDPLKPSPLAPLDCQKCTFASFAGLPVPKRRTLREHHTARLNRGKACFRVLEAARACHTVAPPCASPKCPITHCVNVSTNAS